MDDTVLKFCIFVSKTELFLYPQDSDVLIRVHTYFCLYLQKNNQRKFREKEGGLKFKMTYLETKFLIGKWKLFEFRVTILKKKKIKLKWS